MNVVPVADGGLATEISEVMLHRQSQVFFRLIMALVMIVFFSRYAPLWQMLAWGGVYIAVTGAEVVLTRSGPKHLTSRTYDRLALTVLGLATAVFGFPSVLWACQGGALGVTNGAYLLGGTLLHTVLSARGCKAAFVALLLPLVAYFAITAFIATGPSGNVGAFVTLALGGVSMGTTAVKLWSDASRRRGSELAAQAALLDREAQLGEAMQRAEAANLAKSTFLANMSHEIRTPLNGVLGMAQVMANDDLSPEQLERINMIQASGHDLLMLLNDLLDLSKVEAGKLELEATEFDLEDLVLSALRPYHVQAAAKGVELDATVAEAAMGAYLADPTRIKQIIVNLVSNALKFTKQGAVTVTVDRSGEAIVIEVSDSGIGMSADQLGRLFVPFTQADGSIARRFGGTGLGLAIARQLAELMNGEIGAESVEGEGSTFSVTLPLRRVSQATSQVVASTKVPDKTGGESRQLRILAAEDNPTNQLVLKALLSQTRFDVTLVGDGAAAVAAWERQTWDVILMDVRMPEMDGVTAARLIRDRERQVGRAPTPIICLTANVLAHQLAEYVAAGIDGHVAKPIQVEKLFEAIAEVLRKEEPLADLSDRARRDGST